MIWERFMSAALKDAPMLPFTPPDPSLWPKPAIVNPAGGRGKPISTPTFTPTTSSTLPPDTAPTPPSTAASTTNWSPPRPRPHHLRDEWPVAVGSTGDGDRYIAALMTSLEQLLVVQEHDSALDQLRHRRANLPERQVLTRAEGVIQALAGPLTEASDRRDVVARDVRRLEDEAVAFGEKVKEVEAAMYSGSVTSPRELQAMQADVEQLQRHQRALEDRELELMERQEAIDGELAGLRSRIEAAEADIDRARVSLEADEAAIDREAAAEAAAAGGGRRRGPARSALPVREVPGAGPRDRGGACPWATPVRAAG